MEQWKCMLSAVALVAVLSWSGPAQALVQGIDVSNYQGNINWTSVKNSGIKFAFAKATEGVDYEDPRFDTYMNGAIAAGIPIGPYHFARTNSGETLPTDAIDEADDFVAAIQRYYNGPGLVLRPVLDLEQLPDNSVAPLTVKQYVSKWTRDFCNRVTAKLGVAPIIYTSGNFAQNYFEPDLAQYSLWFAKPITPTPKGQTSDPVFQNNINNVSPPTDAQMGIWSQYAFWQWGWEGVISGISGHVDRNVFNGSIDQLAQYIPGYLPGDFNGDNVVDAADYTNWRNTIGQSVKIGTGADGDFSGVIDVGDYRIWKSKFGAASAGSGAATGAAVPEPVSISLLATAFVLANCFRRRCARCR